MYGEIYYHEYCIDDIGTLARVSIQKQGYTGAATQVDAAVVPFTKALLDSSDSEIVGGIYPTMAKVRLIGTDTFGMDSLYTASDSEFKVVHLIGGQVDWIGFLTPESFGELDTNDLREIEINAFDGLTRLKDLKFEGADGLPYGTSDGQYNKTLMFAVKECLLKTGQELEIHTLVNRAPIIPGQGGGSVSDRREYYPLGDNDGWLYATGFNTEPLSGVVGNIITFRDETGAQYTSVIAEVDNSDVGSGGGRGIRLENPPMQSPIFGQPGFISAIFYTPTPVSGDILTNISHDVRVWTDPETEISRTSKSQRDEPYYRFPDGLVSAWDVLESLAIMLDVKISQDKGVWIVEALDSYLIKNVQLYRYNAQGTLLGRVNYRPSNNVPCDQTKLKYKPAGATKFIDKTLKTVSVGYKYRYKTAEDGLANIFFDPFFENIPMPIPAPGDYTPIGMTRKVLNPSKEIDLNVSRYLNTGGLPGWYFEMYTPDEFNSWNRLEINPIKIGGGDVLRFGWYQSIFEYQTLSRLAQYNTLVIELQADNGDIYYLVNKRDKRGWQDLNNTADIVEGQWIKKSDANVWHFNTNYATSHNPTPSGVWTPMSKVQVVTDDTPVAGEVRIGFVGSSWRGLRTGSTGSGMYDPAKYARAYIATSYDTQEERTVYEAWDPESGQLLSFHKGDFPPKIRITGIEVAIEVLGTREEGRLYSYTQQGDYTDTIELVTTFLGDEDNPSHLSTLKANGAVVSSWVTLDAGNAANSIGLLLARTIMRRYYSPKRMLDGGYSDWEIGLHNNVTFEEDPGIEWSLKGGEIAVKEHLFRGTLFQNLTAPILPGGNDHGPGSLRSGAGSSASLSAGGGGGASNMQGYATQAWVRDQFKTPDWQTVLNVGNVGDKAKVTDLLVIPTKAPLVSDAEAGALWTGDGATAGTPSGYNLPIASASVLGGIKVGANLSIDPTTGVLSALASGDGSVKSVGLSAPTGFTVSNSPVTSTGVLALGFAPGYSLPTTAKQTQWDTAFTNNHTHANKAVLDGITSGKVTNWDAAYTHSTSTGNPHGTTFAQILSKPTTLAGYGITDAVSTARSILAGDGLTGGGNLTADRTLAVDATVVRTSGNQTITGIKTFNTELRIPSAVGTGANAIWAGDGATAGTPSGYNLPIASASVLGGVKIGANLSIDPVTGVLSALGSGSGSVTSVGLSAPTGFTVSNSPVTSAGVLALGFASGYSLPTTAKQTQWDTAFTNSHTHTNKTVLDGITSGLITDWNTAFTNSHTHANKAVLDGITSGLVTNWNTAFTNNHTHANKAVLDGITSAKVINWDAAYTHSTSTGNPHGTTFAQIASKPTTLSGFGITDAVINTRSIITGDGLTGGGNLTADRTLAVDATVVRSSGNQTIAGIKTFSSELRIPSAVGTGANAIWAGDGATAGTPSGYNLPIASASVLGGIKIGANLSIDPATGVLSALGSGSGSVTSVGLSAPTGFTVSNSPVTSTGVLTLGFASGYSLPTTAKQTQWDTAFTNSHTHANKAVLDGITSGLITNWNTAFTNNHTHANKAVLDGITSGLITNWNTAFTNNHTHANKAVLDGITSGLISNWNTAYGWGDHAGKYVLKTGDTMSGKLTVQGAGTGTWRAYGVSVQQWFGIDTANGYAALTWWAQPNTAGTGWENTHASLIPLRIGYASGGDLALFRGAVGAIGTPVDWTSYVFWHTGNLTQTNLDNWNLAYSQRHTHANKANLDTINQNLGTSNNVQFNGITAVNSLQIPAVAGATANTIWAGDGATAGTPSGYNLPIASATVLGGIKVGANLSINPTTGVLSAIGSGSGSVTSVGLSAPTGFTVSNSPVTTAGVLTLGFAAGYSLPTTTKQTQWDAKEDGANKAITLTGSNNTTFPTTKAVTDALLNYVNTTSAQTGILGDKTWEGTQNIVGAGTSGRRLYVQSTAASVASNSAVFQIDSAQSSNMTLGNALLVNTSSRQAFRINGFGNSYFDGKVHINPTNQGAVLELKGVGDGASNYGYVEFRNSQGTLVGYIGKGSTSNDSVTFSNSVGAAYLQITETGVLNAVIGGASKLALNSSLAYFYTAITSTGVITAAGGNSTQWNTAYTHSQATGNPHNTTFAQLISKPTTLAGYGITDAAASSRSILAGDGLAGGGNLTADRTLAVDGTVVRTSGDQTIGGVKTLTSPTIRYFSASHVLIENAITGFSGSGATPSIILYLGTDLLISVMWEVDVEIFSYSAATGVSTYGRTANVRVTGYTTGAAGGPIYNFSAQQLSGDHNKVDSVKILRDTSNRLYIQIEGSFSAYPRVKADVTLSHVVTQAAIQSVAGGTLSFSTDTTGLTLATSATGDQIARWAIDSQVVHTTGAETIAGVKTFSSELRIPSAAGTGANAIWAGDGATAGTPGGYSLPIASASVLGGIKIGANLSIDPVTGVLSALGSGSGSVTSVGLSAPTGFTVSNSPVTSTGVLTLGFASGYSLPTTAKQTQWDTAFTNNHTHANKAVLDGISSGLIANWNTAFTNNHTHTNKTVLDGISSGLIANWNTAFTNNHTHTNKTVLDGISATNVSNWDAAYNAVGFPLSGLTTAAKGSLVASINELDKNIKAESTTLYAGNGSALPIVIELSINATSNARMFAVEIVGNGYNAQPISILVQGYKYLVDPTSIIQLKGIMTPGSATGLGVTYNANNRLCVVVQSSSPYQTFRVRRAIANNSDVEVLSVVGRTLTTEETNNYIPISYKTIATTSDLPTNYVNTTAAQTGILGDKTWEGTQNIVGAGTSGRRLHIQSSAAGVSSDAAVLQVDSAQNSNMSLGNALLINTSGRQAFRINGLGHSYIDGMAYINPTSIAAILSLRGAPGASTDYAYMEFRAANDAAVGYIGKGSGSNNHLTFTNYLGNASLQITDGGGVNILIGGAGKMTMDASVAYFYTAITSTGIVTASGGNSTQWNTAYTHSQTSGNPHNTTFAQIASKPTTLSGFGITDAVINTRSIIAGDGLSGGGNLTADRTLAVDATVVRTSGNQTIAGVKTFSSELRIPSAAGTGANAIWAGDGATAGTPGGYSLPIASASVLGGIKIGANLSIDPVTGVLSALGSGSGSVTSVGLSAPTGFTVSNSPVTSAGVLALGFASGYSLPTTAKQTQWDTAFTNNHTHANKAVLDGITSGLITNWNTAFTNNHTHANKAVLDGITSGKVNNWDAAYGWGNHASAGYLPLSGGTMTGAINSSINNIINFNGSNRVQVDSSNIVLGGNTTGAGGVYLRPQGTGIPTNQVNINGLGVISTSNGDGTSSQWKQAFDWGDHAGKYVLKTGDTMSNTLNITGPGSGTWRVINATLQNWFGLDIAGGYGSLTWFAKPNTAGTGWESGHASLAPVKLDYSVGELVMRRAAVSPVGTNITTWETFRVWTEASLEVGGRNLLLNSNSGAGFFTGYLGATLTKTNNSVSVPEWGVTNANRIVSSGGTSIIKGLLSLSTPAAGAYVSVSGWFKNNHATQSLTIHSNQGGRTDVIAPGQQKRIVWAGILGSGAGNVQIQLRPDSVSGTIDVTWANLQLEKGTVVTDWTPAPEDQVANWAETDSTSFSFIKNKPTIGEGTLTLATGTGLSGSASFSANQTGSATFTVAAAAGYAIPTTAKQTQWDTAFTNNHTHANKSVLDGITSGLVTNWNTAFSNNHTHANKANLDTINQNMGTANSVVFAGVQATVSMRIPTSAPASPQIGDIWIG